MVLLRLLNLSLAMRLIAAVRPNANCQHLSWIICIPMSHGDSADVSHCHRSVHALEFVLLMVAMIMLWDMSYSLNS